MEFRTAQIKDLELIVDIYNSTILSRMVTADTEPVTVIEKLAWFNEHNEQTRPLWVITEQGEDIIGWVSFVDFYGRPAYNGTAEISIYLYSDCRGKGYGKLVLQHCIHQSKSLGIHRLLGFIFSHNLPSLQLFKNAGFREWGCLQEVALMDDKYYSLIIMGIKIP